MCVASIIAWAMFVLVIFSFDPAVAGLTGFFLFYISIFLSIFGSFSVVGILIKYKIMKNDEVVFRQVKRTFRQAFVFALFIVVILFLAQYEFLNWWIFSILLTLYVFVEGLFFTNRKHLNREYVK